MGVVKNLMVRAGADFSAITKQSNKAKSAMKGMSSSVGRSCSQMTAAANGLNKAFSKLKTVLTVTAVISAGKATKAAYDEQAEASAKLARVMRNTMGAGQEEAKAIEDLIDAQERLGVVAGEVQTEGAQELATYLTMSSSLKTLIPVMNDMVAQQYGLAASTENAVSIATMMGKVMNGQTSALSRYGYSFTAAQEAVLRYGTEAQRAAVLAEVVSESVGGMNKALAATPNGRLQQVKNTLGNIQEIFGLAINRLLVLLIPALNTLCSMLERVATWSDKVAQTLVKVFGSGPGNGAAAVVTTDAMAESIDGVTEAAGAASEAVSGLMGFDQINKLASPDAASETDETSGAAVGGAAIDVGSTQEAGETIGWLEARLTSLQAKFAAVDSSKLTGALSRLKEAVAPFTETLFSGLSWAMDKIFVPMGTWTVQDALPAFLDTLATSTTNLSPALSGLQVALQPLQETAFAGLRWAYDNVFIPFASWSGGELLPGFLDVLAGACSALSAAVEALTPLGTWLWDNFLVPIAGWAGGAVVELLGFLADALGRVGDWISTHQAAVENIAVAVGAFAAAWTICNTAVTLWNSIGVISTAVTTAFGGAVAFLTSPVTLVIAAIAALVAIVVLLVKNWDKVKEVAAKVWEGIKNVWANVSAWFQTNVTQPLSEAWTTIKTGVKNAFSNAWTGAKNAWSGAKTWFSDSVITPVSEGFKTFTAGLKPLFSLAWTGIKAVWGGVSTWFTTKIIQPISNGFKKFANGIIGFVEGVANGAISGINKLIGALNKISFNIPEWVPVIGGKTFGFNLKEVAKVQIPRLATGAVIPPNREFAAILGDQTSGMNIETPESLLRSIFREENDQSDVLDMLSRILSAIKEGKVLIADRKVLGKVVREELAGSARSHGAEPVPIG